MDEEFYQEVAPRFTFWPTPAWLWNNNYHGQGINSGYFSTLETRRWIEKLGAKFITSIDESVVFDTETETAIRY